jgi:coenzyme F420-0:L-glutamate ligase/coenzyme F420-1:gamma-L-glutamate ligase
VIEIHPLLTIGEIAPGDDLAWYLAGALKVASLVPERFDVLIVTQKIVSKAAGCYVELESVTPGREALELAQITAKDPRYVQLVLSDSVSVVRAVRNVLITRHRSGHVMANAGIDRSNIGPGGEDRVLLLPPNPDVSALQLRSKLSAYWSDPPAIVISDSFGRPWRYGVTNVAIGASGLPALLDRRGDKDRDGRKLEVTQTALGDMVAAAAGLVTGEGAEGVPAALIRGLRWEAADRPASALVRPLNEDLFQ